ncbi:MAG: hypothetical protein P4M12_07165 [Gammaproteobacteria bacterium]|nr:hypothetical protein [Gammaproteobacteria bacterium]
MNDRKSTLTLPFKSVAGALLFSALLGPVGLLYASSVGGIIMIVIGFVVCCSKLFVPILFVWLISCIWSVLATNRYNKKILQTAM